MLKRYVYALAASLLALGACIDSTHANVLIGGTRVIVPAQAGEVTLRLTNDNTRPALVEAWVDAGDAHSTPETAIAPFLITPPLFRIEPNKGQSLRIIYTHGTLPADRESLFWLNVLEVPPKPSGAEAQDKNLLQLAIRSRLKLFFRPEALAGEVRDAPAQLSWKAVAGPAGVALEVRNPTPYHITLTRVAVVTNGKPHEAELGMVAPMATLRLALKDLSSAPPSGTEIVYTTLNDYGAAIETKGALKP